LILGLLVLLELFSLGKREGLEGLMVLRLRLRLRLLIELVGNLGERRGRMVQGGKDGGRGRGSRARRPAGESKQGGVLFLMVLVMLMLMVLLLLLLLLLGVRRHREEEGAR